MPKSKSDRMKEAVCSFEDCMAPVKVKGLCVPHYRKLKYVPTLRKTRNCTVEGCISKHVAKGFCRNHYYTNLRNGTPISSRRPPSETLWDTIYDVGWTATGSGCWEWNGSRTKKGYGLVSAKRFGFYLAHRTSYFVHIGDFERSLDVCHTCDNPPCINPDHLFVGTHQENEDDKVRKGRTSKGENNFHAKLSTKDVLEILDLYSTGEYLQKDLATEYKVSRSTICNIVNNKYWSNVYA